MKILASLICMFGLGLTAFAQLPAGSTAPDFNVKDITGKNWRLYDVLATGRPVIMDVSATWCGPCWSYHNGGALDTYFAEHGPEGDGKSMVFWVEGDGATNLACLSGPSGCVGGTQGNWVNGTHFPIFDNAGIANSYQIGYFPTIYLICPDKTVREIGQLSAAALWNQAKNCVGDVPKYVARPVRLDPNAFSGQICNPQTARPRFTLQSFGSEILTSATLELVWNGTVVQTKDWTGTLHAFEEELISFSTVEIPTAGKLSVVVKNPNGDATAEALSTDFDFVDAPPSHSGTEIAFQLRTDGSGKDIFWAIYDENEQEIARGGNEQVGPNGGGAFPGGAPADPSAYGNLKVINDTFSVVANTCFTLRIVDGVGNGLTPPGSYKFFDLGSTTHFYQRVSFPGAYEKRTFAPKGASSANDPALVDRFSVYPNPVAEVLTVDYALADGSKVDLVITNAVGQILRREQMGTQIGGAHQAQIPVSELAGGVYFLSLRTEHGAAVRKFTVAK